MIKIRPLSRRVSRPTDIARQLHDMIQAGHYRTGQYLPGHRELATQFGTSIATLREAMSALAAAGLVKAHPGRGTMVLKMSEAEPQFDGWLGRVETADEIADLLQIRLYLETWTVAKAANVATPRQVARLRSLLKRMSGYLQDPEHYVEADLAFHKGIADVANNKVVMRIMKAIQVPLRLQLQESARRHMDKSGHMEISYASHVRMVDAIADRDSAAAVRSLEEMVARAEQLIQAPEPGNI